MLGCSVLVNTARAGLVEEYSLRKALDGGRIGAYSADVFDEEPSRGSFLLTHERAILTSHIGALTDRSARRAADMAGDQLLEALNDSAGGSAVAVDQDEYARVPTQKKVIPIPRRRKGVIRSSRNIHARATVTAPNAEATTAVISSRSLPLPNRRNKSPPVSSSPCAQKKGHQTFGRRSGSRLAANNAANAIKPESRPTQIVANSPFKGTAFCAATTAIA